MTTTTPALAWQDLVPVTRVVHCERCRQRVALACSGLGGTVMYETFNEYLCPSCGGRNYARTPGNIVAARAPQVVA
jgi:DNA-directed RNA polymerase subunit RPC12/RpoP